MMGGSKVVTVWIPLQRTGPTMGSLIFSHPQATPQHESESDSTAAAAADGHVVYAEGQCAAHPCKQPKPPMDAWGVAALHGRGSRLDEQTEEYDSLVSAALEADGCVPDIATYDLGDISIHLTSCFHRTAPNLAGTPRVILAATYFADGTTARCDIDVATMTQGQRNDWKKFAPGVRPQEVIATRLNPLLEHP